MSPIDPAASPEAVVAQRLNTLCDVAAPEGGRRYTYPEISAAVAERGVHISRAQGQAQLDLLRSMKEVEVKTYAARSLTKDLSTERCWRSGDIIDQPRNEQSTEP